MKITFTNPAVVAVVCILGAKHSYAGYLREEKDASASATGGAPGGFVLVEEKEFDNFNTTGQSNKIRHRDLLSSEWRVFANMHPGWGTKYLEAGGCYNGAPVHVRSASYDWKSPVEFHFAQQFRWRQNGNGHYEIESRNCPGKVLDIKDANCYNGATVQLWSRSGGTNQNWKVAEGGDEVTFRSGRCSAYLLDMAWSDEGKVHIWQTNSKLWSSSSTVTGGESQRWLATDKYPAVVG